MAANPSHQAFLQSLEQDYSRPQLVRSLMPSLNAGALTVTVGLAAGQGNPVNAGPINFAVTFSKPVTGFVNADVSFVGSTVGGTLAAAVTGGPSSYNVAVSGMTGNGLVAVSVIPGAAVDATGNLTPGSIAAYVTLLTTGPSVTINQAAGQADPTAVSPINFTVVFSASVTGFVASDVSLTGSTATGTLSINVTGGPSTYNVAVTGMTGAGNVVASIPAGGATDPTGNTSLASTSTDNTVAFDPAGTWPSLSNTGPAGIGITTFLPWTFGPILDASNAASFPIVGGYRLVQGYEVLNTAINVGPNVSAWKFRGCRFVSPNTNGWNFQIDSPADNIVFEYCEFGSNDAAKTVIVPFTGGVNHCLNIGSGSNVEVAFCQFYHWATAISNPLTQAKIHDCFIFNPRSDGGIDHTDGIILNFAANNTIINHNWIENRLAQTDCIALFGSNGHNGITITNNYLAGGGYPLYGGGEVTPGVTNGTFTGNRFSTKFFPLSGANGPYSNDPRINGTNVVWNNNRFVDATGLIDGAIIP